MYININYIITSNKNYNNPEPIKVFDFNGNKVKEIYCSNDTVYYIDIYYDNNLLQNYIITGNDGYTKSYDYNKNEIYQKYYEVNNDGTFSIIINKKEKIIELIESSCDGNVRIWDFHSSFLLKKIKVSNERLREICMWNNKYIFVGCDDKTIKLIQINNGKIIKELEGHINNVLSIKKFIHPKYGKCLLSQGAYKDSIKLWII